MSLKKTVIPLIRITGVIRLVLFLFRKRLPIIEFHGVMSPKEDERWHPVWERVDPQDLDKALSVLTKYYQIVSMDDFVSYLGKQSQIPSNVVALTFDDGYSNNLTHAWPIVKKYNGKMIVYVATKFCKDRKAFWIDAADFALFSKFGEQNINVNFGDQQFQFDLSNRNAYKNSYAKFRKAAKSAQFDDDYLFLSALDEVVSQLESGLQITLKDFLESDHWARPATYSEMKAAEAGLDFGAHTVNHARLTKVNNEDCEKELVDSKSEMLDATGRECEHFCYPNGDCDSKVVKAVEQAGYKSAVTTEVGTNDVDSNPYLLKRLPFPKMSDYKNIDFWLAKEFLREFFLRPQRQ